MKFGQRNGLLRHSKHQVVDLGRNALSEGTVLTLGAVLAYLELELKLYGYSIIILLDPNIKRLEALSYS